MSNLQPIGKSILFVFTDDVIAGQFVSKHNNGIVNYRNYNDGLNNARYATVTHIGINVDSNITVGSTILIEPLQWTESFTYNKAKMWLTTSDKVLAIVSA